MALTGQSKIKHGSAPSGRTEFGERKYSRSEFAGRSYGRAILGLTERPSSPALSRIRLSRVRIAKSSPDEEARIAEDRCRASSVRTGSTGKGRRARAITSGAIRRRFQWAAARFRRTL